MTPRQPWQPSDVLLATTLQAIGLAAIVTSWAWARGQTDDSTQLTGVAVAIGGLLLAELGTLVLLMNARRAVTQRRRMIAEHMAAR